MALELWHWNCVAAKLWFIRRWLPHQLSEGKSWWGSTCWSDWQACWRYATSHRSSCEDVEDCYMVPATSYCVNGGESFTIPSKYGSLKWYQLTMVHETTPVGTDPEFSICPTEALLSRPRWLSPIIICYIALNLWISNIVPINIYIGCYYGKITYCFCVVLMEV